MRMASKIVHCLQSFRQGKIEDTSQRQGSVLTGPLRRPRKVRTVQNELGDTSFTLCIWLIKSN